MKSIASVLSLLLVLMSSNASFAAKAPKKKGLKGPKTEIQIFLGYRGLNDYDAKLVSDREYVVNAGVLYFSPNEDPTNAACYKGDPWAALELFQDMVYEMEHPVSIRGTVVQDGLFGRPYLRILEFDPVYGERVWFERLRECVRWSTPLERQN